MVSYRDKNDEEGGQGDPKASRSNVWQRLTVAIKQTGHKIDQLVACKDMISVYGAVPE